MKTVINLIIVEFKKEIQNWKLYAGFLGFCILCFLIKNDYGKSGALQTIDVMLGLSNTASLLVILASLPGSCTFSDDWENGFYKFIINRSSVKKYIISKILVCALSAFVVAFTAFSTFGIIEYAVNGSGADAFYPGAEFYDLIHSDYNILYIFIRSAFFALVISLFSEYGLMGSALFPNKFVAVAFPLISSIILREVSFKFNYGGISLHSIESCCLTGVSEYITAFITFIIYALIANVVFSYVIRRRVRCEIN
jgi:hypothetical protein